MLATRFALYPLGIVTSLIVAGYLGAESLGAYALASVFVGLVVPLCSFGMAMGVVYYVSSGKYSPQQAAGATSCAGLLHGVIASLIVWTAWRVGWLGESGSLLGAAEMAALLVSLPAAGAQLMLTRLLIGMNWFSASNMATLVRAGLQPILLLMLVLGLGWGLSGAIYAMAISLWIALLINVFQLAGLGILRFPNLEFAKAAFVYGLRGWTSVAFGQLNGRVDQLILSAFAGAAALGNYALAVKIAELPWVLCDAVSTVVFNRLAKGGPDEQRRLVAIIHRSMFFATVAGSVALAAVGYLYVVPIFGADFSNAPLLIVILSLSSVGLIGLKVLSKYFGAVGRPGLNGWIGAITGLLGLGLYAWLIPAHGIWGAAWATVIIYWSRSIAGYIVYRHAFHEELYPLFLPRPVNDVQWGIAQIRRGMSTGA